MKRIPSTLIAHTFNNKSFFFSIQSQLYVWHMEIFKFEWTMQHNHGMNLSTHTEDKTNKKYKNNVYNTSKEIYKMKNNSRKIVYRRHLSRGKMYSYKSEKKIVQDVNLMWAYYATSKNCIFCNFFFFSSIP